MLFRKMLRDFKMNFGAFFSVFLLSALAMALFVTFEGHVLSQGIAREAYHKECNLSDVWVYGEGFSDEQLENVRKLDSVQSAQLRTSFTGSAPEFDGAQVDMILERENTVDTPYYISGEPFDPKDTEGVWIANAFAQKRNLHVGDSFTMEYDGVRFTREIKGLIESAEYEYRQADGDADVYLENIAIAYMSYDAFPAREYINHLVEQGKLTIEDLLSDSKEKKSDNSKVQSEYMSLSQQFLSFAIGAMDDDTLMDYMPYTQMVIRTKDGAALAHEEEIADALGHDYSAMINRKSVPGLARLDSELEQHQAFSYVFVVIFVGIAILVIATTMSRMVAKQRTQIGTMNALGMKKWKIMLHYISFSFFVSLLGVIIGLAVGVQWGCPMLMEIFGGFYIVPGLHSVFHPMYLVISAVIIAACIVSAFLSCRKLLKIRPAEALRPAPPKQGRSCLFEKLPFWEKLSFASQYNLRDISRAKLRTFMCVIGTAVGMLLMVYGVGCSNLVSTMVDLNFEKVAVSEYQTKLSSDAKLADVDALSELVDGELVMQDQIEIAKVKDASSTEKKKETITVVEGKHKYNILDVNNQVTNLVPGTIGLSRKLAADMDIQVGDTIYWHLYSKNTWYEAKVGIIYRCSETQGIAYLREDYEKTGADYIPTLLMSDKKPEQDVQTDSEQKLITAVNSKAEMEAAYATSMETVSILVIMMIAFSAILLVVVLYNSGSLSFHEREKEFATLKVLGFRSERIRRLISIQNLWLSIIGIIIGTPLGNVSLNAMMNSNGENFDYLLSVPVYDYVIAGALVLFVSMLVSLMFSKRIRKLDMVEVLKGCE